MPIYKVTTELLIGVIHAMRRMDRDFKHTIGQRMVTITLDMISCLRDARDNPKDKERDLRKFIGLYDNLQVLFKICVDDENLGFKIIRCEDYTHIIPKMASVERQAVGWLRSIVPTEDSDIYPEFAGTACKE